MAIEPMADAMPGTVALSAEYNKLILNIEDLDERLTAATNTNTTQNTDISALQSAVNNGTTGNTALGNRVTALETRPACAVRLTAATTAINSGTNLTWAAEDYDTAGMWSSGTGVTIASGQTGLYEVVFQVVFNGANGGGVGGAATTSSVLGGYVTVNGDNGTNNGIGAIETKPNTGPTANQTIFQIVARAFLNSGDIVRGRVYADTGTGAAVKSAALGAGMYGGTYMSVLRIA